MWTHVLKSKYNEFKFKYSSYWLCFKIILWIFQIHLQAQQFFYLFRFSTIKKKVNWRIKICKKLIKQVTYLLACLSKLKSYLFFFLSKLKSYLFHLLSQGLSYLFFFSTYLLKLIMETSLHIFSFFSPRKFLSVLALFFTFKLSLQFVYLINQFLLILIVSTCIFLNSLAGDNYMSL